MNNKIKENINKTESNEISIDDINKEISKINNSLEKVDHNESSINEVKNEIKKINYNISQLTVKVKSERD
jgi:DNA repair ATPase RecN